MEGPRQGFEVMARLLNILSFANVLAAGFVVGVILGVVWFWKRRRG